jgi:hypothetical protein
MIKKLIYIFVFIIVIQLIPIKKNQTSEPMENSIYSLVSVPENVENIIKKSCNDCHSNNTRYEWYHSVAPFSWAVAYHIKDGKKHLNFDEWGSYNKYQKESIISDLRETIETREMPLVGYLKVHPEAVVSDKENQELLDWINTLEK